MSIDAVDLARRLIRCPSVTPEEGGAIRLMQATLETHGFSCTRTDRNGIANLYARRGRQGPVLGFNGHVDVVPAGDPAVWSVAPFGGELRDGKLWGRGACDMKSAVAAFAAAATDLAEPAGSVVLAITGDEEGDGVDGTAAILDWMEATGERMDACIVGEPTCPARMGEMIKIGRRGSMTAWITATGRQGHSAYPAQGLNPIHAMVALLARLTAFDLDDSSDLFDPTTVQVTGFDTGNTANNVIPARCTAMVNIRFNDAHDSTGLSAWMAREAEAVAAETGVAFAFDTKISGESFVTEPGSFSELIQNAVEAEVGLRPVLSTSGGTSDARHIRRHCPVVEIGLVNATMHQVDEHVEIAQIHQLKAIYGRILRDYFT